MAQPEKLNLWDRFFNRYRKEIVEEGVETWVKRPYDCELLKYKFNRNFVKYKIIDRVTGSEEIEIDYLNGML
jgi:hypothetical protein